MCPAFTALRSVQTTLDGDRIPIGLGAQNCHWETAGRVHRRGQRRRCSRSCNVQYVIVGHSERRELFGETDEMVAKKLRAVLAHEHGADRVRGGDARGARGGRTDAKVDGPDRAPRSPVLPIGQRCRVVVAYEPIWAIGTGRNATPEDANATIGVDPGRAAGHVLAPRPPPRSGSCTAAA